MDTPIIPNLWEHSPFKLMKSLFSSVKSGGLRLNTMFFFPGLYTLSQFLWVVDISMPDIWPLAQAGKHGPGKRGHGRTPQLFGLALLMKKGGATPNVQKQ